MGFESYFTLYRKYNTSVSADEIKEIVGKYARENRERDYSEEKKSEEEYAKDIPIVLDPMYGERGDVYNSEKMEWEDRRDHSIAGQRKNFNYVLASDGSNLDELLVWCFGSDFNCLSEEYGLGHRRNRNEVVIDRHTAEEMLQACNYLLSGKWSTDTEDILDNRWIDVFANGNSGNPYWPYVYRNDPESLKEIPEGERDNLKYSIRRTRCALEAYLKSEDGLYSEDKWEYLLIYSISY